MWKTILTNINNLILSNWKTLFTFALGVAAGLFLLSCSMINAAVDTAQEAGNDVAEFVTGSDDEAETVDE
jgi:hypothetical protein